MAGQKTVFLSHLCIKRTYYQDRLGTNIGKALKKRVTGFCFDKTHNHEPGFGKWMAQGWKDLMQVLDLTHGCFSSQLFLCSLQESYQAIVCQEGRLGTNTRTTEKREACLFSRSL